jgi:hypothetical protein
LQRFRSAITRFSEGIASAQWEPDFRADLDETFQHEIRPLILGLEDEIRSNGYLRTLVAKFTSDPKKFAAYSAPAGLSLLAAGHGWLSPLIVAVAAGVPVALGATDAWMDVIRKGEAIKNNQMFFYYETRRRLEDTNT